MTRARKPLAVDAPPRLKDNDAHPLSQLVRDVPEIPPLSEIALARVHRSLMEASRPRRGRLVAYGLRTSLVVALLLVGASVGAAAVLSVRWLESKRAPAALPSATPAPLAHKASSHPRRAKPLSKFAEAPAALAPTEAPPMEASPAALPPRARFAPVVTSRPRADSRAPRAEAAVSDPAVSPPPARADAFGSAAPASALAQEGAQLAEALRALRRAERSSAIFALRRYLRNHADGYFRQEAEVALLTALVDAGAHDEAKAQLAEVPSALQAAPALRLLRAELAFDDRCQEAAPLFNEALSRLPAGPLRERALYGAAMADWRCGDRARGLTRMRQFLSQYPASTRAANVKAHLLHAQNLNLSPEK